MTFMSSRDGVACPPNVDSMESFDLIESSEELSNELLSLTQGNGSSNYDFNNTEGNTSWGAEDDAMVAAIGHLQQQFLTKGEIQVDSSTQMNSGEIMPLQDSPGFDDIFYPADRTTNDDSNDGDPFDEFVNEVLGPVSQDDEMFFNAFESLPGEDQDDHFVEWAMHKGYHRTPTTVWDSQASVQNDAGGVSNSTTPRSSRLRYLDAAKELASSAEPTVSNNIPISFKRLRTEYKFESLINEEKFDEAYGSDNDDEEEESKEPANELPQHLSDRFLKKMSSLTSKMSSLDLEESEIASVCGFETPLEETPGRIQVGLRQMDEEINALKASQGSSYLLAESANPDYVADPVLRLLFLRIFGFNAKDAAAGMLEHFDIKLDLWGPERIGTKITIANMGDGPRRALENGHMQILPSKDLAGRRVIINNANRQAGFDDPYDQIRLLHFLISTIVEDEDVQRRGVVFIQLKVGPVVGTMQPSKKVLWKGLTITRKFPLNAVCHLCLGQRETALIGLFRFAANYFSRRLQVHVGTFHDHLNTLATFGIKREELPFTENGEMLLENHRKWIHHRRILESHGAAIASAKASVLHLPTLPKADGKMHHLPLLFSAMNRIHLVMSPENADVLLGPEGEVQLHPGNIRFQLRLDDYRRLYSEASPVRKKYVVSAVIDAVHSSGGRFLQQTDVFWTIADREIVRTKVTGDFNGISSSIPQVDIGLDLKPGEYSQDEFPGRSHEWDDKKAPQHVNLASLVASSAQWAVGDNGGARTLAPPVSSPHDAGLPRRFDDDDGYAERQDELPIFLRNESLYMMNELASTKDNPGWEQHAPFVDEDAAHVGACLQRMDDEIIRLRVKSGGAYLLAENSNPDYVKNPKLRIMFLRSCGFRPDVAARQLFEYFEAKLDLWGPELIAQDITIANMGDGPRGALENGHMQLLPSKDSKGRRVILNNVNRMGGTKDGEDMMRLMWYLASVALEEEDTQRSGMVYIQFLAGKRLGTLQPRKTTLWKGFMVSRCFPVTTKEIHLCVDRRKWSLIWLFRVAAATLSSSTKVHEGNPNEIIDALANFGIMLPVKKDGGMMLTTHNRWIRDRKVVETRQATSIAPSAAAPRYYEEFFDSDVLLGRGQRSQTHEGNLRLASLLEDYLSAFDEAPKKRKKFVVRTVANAVKNYGGRFLVPVSDGFWEEADESKIEGKISHDFRTMRGILKKRGQSFAKGAILN